MFCTESKKIDRIAAILRKKTYNFDLGRFEYHINKSDFSIEQLEKIEVIALESGIDFGRFVARLQKYIKAREEVLS